MATDPKTNQAIVGGSYGMGIRHVGAYQVAGHPFITGSSIATAKCQMVEFPYISNNFTVINQTPSVAGTYIRVHFQSGSTTTAIAAPGASGEQSFADTAEVITRRHYITLSGSDSVTFNSRCTKLYVSNLCGTSQEYQVAADLTLIPASKMYHLTGSGITS
jgi:hypothetical protein